MQTAKKHNISINQENIHFPKSRKKRFIFFIEWFFKTIKVNKGKLTWDCLHVLTFNLSSSMEDESWKNTYTYFRSRHNRSINFKLRRVALRKWRRKGQSEWSKWRHCNQRQFRKGFLSNGDGNIGLTRGLLLPKRKRTNFLIFTRFL